MAAGSPEDPLQAEATQTFYVAPQPVADAHGRSPDAAANFRDKDFWSLVQQALQMGPVDVYFLDGTYFVSADEKNGMPPLVLADLGHPKHLLSIKGMSKDGVVFTRLGSDSMEGTKGPGFLQLTRSQNVTVRHLHFTSKHPISYATHFGGSKDVVIYGCTWIDLPGVYYGATGTAEPSTDHVTFVGCQFKRVGSSGHAHMAYNAYGPQHIRFANCHFEDCAGDYIRFRAGTDYGVVVGCTFRSTGAYRGVNVPFITVPLFNDDNPEEQLFNRNFEYFGTHFLIANNTFDYANDKQQGTRAAFLFHHSGFDPPGRNHLLTPEEAELLGAGKSTDRKALLSKKMGIDVDSVHFFGNRFHGVDLRVGYRCHAAFGAPSKGWSGLVNIAELVNPRQTIDTAEQALAFFESHVAAAARERR